MKRFLPAAALFLTAGSALCGTGAPAREPRFELETGAWYADNRQDSALVWGPSAAWTEAGWAARAHLREGLFNAGGDKEDIRDWRVTAGWRPAWFEVGAGVSGFDFSTELQAGWSWSYPAEEAERNADIWGPVLYAILQHGEPAARLGWRVGATWMPHDFGDFDALGYDGAHVDLEAAVHVGGPAVRAGAGYRYVRFADLPARAVNDERRDRDVLSGIEAFLSFRW